jgi:hypothetical protein
MAVLTRRSLCWTGISLLVVIGLTTWASASAYMTASFRTLYAPKEGTDLAKAMPCLVCHTAMPATKTNLNPYAVDLAKAAAGKPVDEKTYKAIEGLDSDKDGFKNGVELKAGTLPGDPKSKPK